MAARPPRPGARSAGLRRRFIGSIVGTFLGERRLQRHAALPHGPSSCGDNGADAEWSGEEKSVTGPEESGLTKREPRIES